MSAYRMQSKNGGDGAAPVLPIIVNNNNFAKGAPGAPTLLSFDDARTLFHEFGHGLHGLLSNVTYERVSGTNVLRDFVELPSQLFEHWLEEPEVLKRHARHYRTGAPIPDALIARLHEARHFNQGYETVRYAASALVDMAAHARTEGEPIDVVAFERAEFERLGLPAGVGVNHRLTHFQHLFSGSAYAAGYYVYLWAEVLDADGFEAFVEAGDPFDREVARRAPALHLFVRKLDRARCRVPCLPRSRRATRADAAPARSARAGRELARAPLVGDRRLGAGAALARKPAFERGDEDGEVDRLGPVVGEARRQAALDVLAHRVGRQGDARNRAAFSGRRAAGAGPRSRRSRAAAGRSGQVGAQRDGASDAGRAGGSETIARPPRLFTSSSTSSTLTWLSSM